MRAVLGETFRLLGRHLHLFTLISLTVWLPTHVLLNYLEFFDPGEEAAGRALRIVLTAQVVLDPFVVSAMLSALVHIKQGGPVSYWQALAEGFSAWPRLMLVRFMVIWVLLMPSLGWLAIYAAGAGGAAGGRRAPGGALAPDPVPAGPLRARRLGGGAGRGLAAQRVAPGRRGHRGPAPGASSAPRRCSSC